VSRTAALDVADPTESYAQDDTPLLRACYEMSRCAHVSADDPRGYLTNSYAPSVLLHVRRTGYGGPDARRPNPAQPRPYRPRRIGVGQPRHRVLCAAIRKRC